MLLPNPQHSPAAPLRTALEASLGREGRAIAARFLSACPAYRPTPLVSLPALAAKLGIAALHVKDESTRLGLGSFKALGGAYAVMRLVLEEAATRLGRALEPAALVAPDVKAIAATMTMTCATDGNHGRSVAAGARIAGCNAVIFVHGGVSEARAAAIAAQGARIMRVAGTYDDSVAEATRVAARNGWTVVSDTSWEGYQSIPLLVMQGYTIMAGEAFDALALPPTHIFLQAGVGGMAAAVAAHATAVYGNAALKIIVVEPDRAACLFESAKAGRLTTAPHTDATIMAMLECYEASPVAWEVLGPGATAFMTVSEEGAVAAMNQLAKPGGHDAAIEAGESGGAGLAGLMRVARDTEMRRATGLDAAARVLLINSEGATDPARYAEFTGLDVATVRAKAAGGNAARGNATKENA